MQFLLSKGYKLGGIIILAHPYLISEPVSYKGKEMSDRNL